MEKGYTCNRCFETFRSQPKYLSHLAEHVGKADNILHPVETEVPTYYVSEAETNQAIENAYKDFIGAGKKKRKGIFE